jgi:hypothetical protein
VGLPMERWRRRRHSFHRFVDYPSFGRSKSGSPAVFGVVVTAGYEALPKGSRRQVAAL